MMTSFKVLIHCQTILQKIVVRLHFQTNYTFTITLFAQYYITNRLNFLFWPLLRKLLLKLKIT